jgi:hypothetical protein
MIYSKGSCRQLRTACSAPLLRTACSAPPAPHRLLRAACSAPLLRVGFLSVTAILGIFLSVVTIYVSDSSGFVGQN